MKGVKEPEIAKNAENDLVRCAEYLADPRNINLNKMGSPQDDWRKREHPRVTIALAKGYIELGMNDKALEKLDAAYKEVLSGYETTKYDASDHRMLLDIAEQLMRIEKKDKAIEILDYAASKSHLLWTGSNPQSADIINLYRAYYKAGEIKKAEKVFNEIPFQPSFQGNEPTRFSAKRAYFDCLIVQGKYDDVLNNPSAPDKNRNKDILIFSIVNEEQNSGNYKSALEYIKKIQDLNWRISLIARLVNTKIDDEEYGAELDRTIDACVNDAAGYTEPERIVQGVCGIAEIYMSNGKEERGRAVLQNIVQYTNKIDDKKSKEKAKWLIATTYANLGDFENALKIKPSRSTVDDKYGYFPAQIYIAATAVGYARNGDYDKAMKVAREHNNKYKKSPHDFLVEIAKVIIKRGDYDKAYSILETAYDTRWKDEHDYRNVLSIITTPKEYYFVECPKMFIDVNRVDLAIKCLRFIESKRMEESDIVETLMMIEKKRREIGYALKDSDKAVLRGIIHSDNMFASYNRNFVEQGGLSEVTIEI